MASLLGARLARAGEDVTLAGTWREAIAAIGAGGVRVEDADGSWAARVRAVPLDAPLPQVELELVLVKSYRTAVVAPTAARSLGPRGVALTLQNGLGNRETLEAAVGPGRALLGVTIAGATLLGPGRVRGYLGRTSLGDDGRGAAQDVAARFRRAGLEVEVCAEVERLVWRKLVANCAINPLTALLGVENGALLERPAWRASLEDAAREVGRVAAARGLDLGEDPAVLAVSVAQVTARNRSSMLHDLERGAPTEIEAINGAVVREGRRLGVATPVNEDLARRVRERELALVARGAP